MKINYPSMFNYQRISRFKKIIDYVFICTEKKRSRILDAGCGPGVYTIFLKTMGLDIVGMDIQKSLLDGAIDHCVNKGIESNFVCASIAQLPFSEGSFNMVILSEVLEHLEDDYRALMNIKNVLSKDGLLILSVPRRPYRRTSWEEEEKLRGNIPFNIHVREGYQFEDISKLLSQTGFRIIKHSYCGYKIEQTIKRLFRIRPLSTEFHREEIKKITRHKLFSIYKCVVFPVIFILLIIESLPGKKIGETLIAVAKAV